MVDGEVFKGTKEGSTVLRRINSGASSHLTLREGTHVETCNDTKVVATTSKREVEIRILLNACIDNAAIG